MHAFKKKLNTAALTSHDCSLAVCIRLDNKLLIVRYGSDYTQNNIWPENDS